MTGISLLAGLAVPAAGEWKSADSIAYPQPFDISAHGNDFTGVFVPGNGSGWIVESRGMPLGHVKIAATAVDFHHDLTETRIRIRTSLDDQRLAGRVKHR
ncbi:hypothetical protein D3C75_613580 [compost metagenome]